MPNSLSSLNETQMATIILSKNCDLLRYSNQIFKIASSGLSSVPGFTSSIKASSSDLQYLIVGRSLYTYVSAISSYSALIHLNSHTKYWIKTNYNEIVAWGATATQNGNGKYTVEQTVYIIYNNAGVNILKQTSITAY